jgi:L-ascorbate metabolism protein UlaG (beta-lactamase superfamily)
MNNKLPYLCPPSAKNILLNCGIRESQITTITPGGTYRFSKGGNALEVQATTGALLGPPWGKKENGYIISPTPDSAEQFSSIYYEPHCMYNKKELSQYKADIVITPVVAQKLPLFTLVAGGKKAVNLAKILGAKYIVPMRNGGLEQRGALTRLVRARGSEDKFLKLAKEKLGSVEILRAPAGELVIVP